LGVKPKMLNNNLISSITDCLIFDKDTKKIKTYRIFLGRKKKEENFCVLFDELLNNPE
jgi:hypothetical protein